jgi:putative ABC transport system substrate-binding protein
LARPGGNITGFTFIEFAMVGKWLQMLKEVAPAVARAGIMFNPQTAPYYDVYLRSFEAMPRLIAVELAAAPVRNGAEIEAVIAKLGREPGGGLIVPPDPFTVVHRDTIMKSAELHRLPVVWSYRQFVTEGALMSYGPDTADIFRRSASYVDLILKGAKPADLPAQSPIKFELVINLKSAKALGLDVPPMLLARADEVIE